MMIIELLIFACSFLWLFYCYQDKSLLYTNYFLMATVLWLQQILFLFRVNRSFSSARDTLSGWAWLKMQQTSFPKGEELFKSYQCIFMTEFPWKSFDWNLVSSLRKKYKGKKKEYIYISPGLCFRNFVSKHLYKLVFKSFWNTWIQTEIGEI